MLKIHQMTTVLDSDSGLVRAVEALSLTIERGETFALVGESGCGKSMTALSILRLLPDNGRVESGTVEVDGTEIMALPESRMRDIRGRRISIIFQEPSTSLNPVMTVGRQITEVIERHTELRGQAARAKAVEWLDRVGIPEPERRLDTYPFQMSGGQKQRVMIAIALAAEPDLVIADEPTTALDVTIQAQILALLAEVQRQRGMGMLFITHNLAIVRRIADRVAVMQGGEIVETGPTAEIFARPQHPYTRKLLAAEPHGRPDPLAPGAPAVIETERLRVWFPIRRGLLRRTVGHIKAVNEASVAIRAGETLGVVGESGSGKTTLALAMMRLIASEGRIVFLGRDIQGLRSKQLRGLRRDMQMVFQDPYGSLSPRMSIEQIVAEGLGVHGLGGDAHDRVAAILTEVGLDPAVMDRYPHEFSGGQRQRIAIARAMILQPKLVVLDEPTSALDMTVQVQIVELLRALQTKYGLAYVFISHDLRVVRALAHAVVVMQNGDVVECGPADAIFDAPAQPYTRTLLAAAFDETSTTPEARRADGPAQAAPVR